MEENYRAGIYWSSRRESVVDCAKRTKQMLRCLSKLDTRFGSWYLSAKSKTQSLNRPLSEELSEIEKGFRLSEVHELGYQLGLWNGMDSQSVGLQISCGCYSEILPLNSCVLNLPKGDLLKAGLLVQVMVCLATAWEPDWGVVTTSLYRNSVTQYQGKNNPYIGWITYFSRKFGALPILPNSAKVIDLDIGLVVIVTDDLFTVTNQVHVQTARDVQQILEKLKWI